MREVRDKGHLPNLFRVLLRPSTVSQQTNLTFFALISLMTVLDCDKYLIEEHKSNPLKRSGARPFASLPVGKRNDSEQDFVKWT